MRAEALVVSGVPRRLGMAPDAYEDLMERVADALAVDAGEEPGAVTPCQRVDDMAQAEWLVAVLFVAGFVPTAIDEGRVLNG